jgi:hypothetical protein
MEYTGRCDNDFNVYAIAVAQGKTVILHCR